MIRKKPIIPKEIEEEDEERKKFIARFGKPTIKEGLKE